MVEVEAVWNGTVIATADASETKTVEGNIYFPPTALKKEFLKESTNHTTCPWKGEASYYHVEIDGKTNEDAAWYYPDPLQKAKELGIKNFVAFWRGVEIRKV